MVMPRGELHKIDLGEIEKLGMLCCTIPEMAGWFRVSESTIAKRLAKPAWREAYDRGRSQGLLSLRRKQMQMAQGGSVPMLIWLGKQLLGQREPQNVTADDAAVVEQRIKQAVADLAAKLSNTK